VCVYPNLPEALLVAGNLRDALVVRFARHTAFQPRDGGIWPLYLHERR
jgi:hypothetical protein